MGDPNLDEEFYKMDFLIKKMVFLTLLIFSISALAVINQARLWGGVDISGSLFDSPDYLYDFFPQTRTNLTEGEYQETHTDFALGYKVSPNFSLWQGYTSILPGTVGTQNQIWQQAIWRVIDKPHFTLENRFRFEERRRVGELQWANTARERVRLFFPNMLFDKLTPIISDEVIFNVNHPDWVNDQTVNQNRAFVGIRIPVRKNTSFDIGYLNQFVFQNEVDQDNHILYLNINITT